MTTILINSVEAILPVGMELNFVSENAYFSRSSNYTLDIDLPMPVNSLIFGNINRLSMSKNKIIYPASIYVDGRCILSGSAVVVQVGDSLVKIQLVAGNAEFNLLTNDNIYLDEIDLGEIKFPYPANTNGFLPIDKYVTYYGSIDDGQEIVWLPVLYEEDKLLNSPCYEFGTDAFQPAPYGVSSPPCIQPYLLTVIKRVVEFFGYKFNDSIFNNSFIRHIYVVNALATTKITKALPHWTISEFFNEIENFLGAITLVDERTKEVVFIPLNNYFNNIDLELIDRSQIIDQYEVDITDSENDKDIGSSNISYDLGQQADDGYYRMDKTVFAQASKIEYTSYDDLKNAWAAIGDKDDKKYNNIFVANRRYYINYKVDDKNTLREVNLYGDLIRDSEDDSAVDLRIVPAKIVQYNIGLYGSIAEFHLNRPYVPLKINIPFASYHGSVVSNGSFNVQEVIEGNITLEKQREKNDKLEVAINTGVLNVQKVTYQNQTHSYHYAYPFTDYMQKTNEQTTDFLPYSLSLNDLCEDSMGHRLAPIKTFHSGVTYCFSFVSEFIPDVKKVFLIANQRYLCEKIELGITADGLNKIMKGYFYKI